MTDAGVVTAVLALLDFAVKVLALGLLPQNRRPSSAMAWLLLVCSCRSWASSRSC